MIDPVKGFEADYKKCRIYGEDDVKHAKVMSERVKFFGYDMRCGLDELEEVVLEEKASAEPITATKIEDYAKANKGIAGLLKDVLFNLARVADSCKALNNLPKVTDITASSKKLNGLKKDIDGDLKKRSKTDKSRPAIEKLQKQIDADLKVMEDYAKLIKKIPADYFVATKEYDAAINYIMKAKPKLSAKTKKFNDLAPKKLKRDILNKMVKQSGDLNTAVKLAAKNALSAAKASNSKELITHWQAGTRDLQKLQKTVEEYLDIKKKYPKEIGKSEDKKQIEKAIATAEKIKLASEKNWQTVEAEIKKASTK